MLLSSISLLLLLSSANAEPQDIIGGEVLPKGKRPYLASLGSGPSNVVGERAGHGCGASLIHPNVVLTAAHCVTCEPKDEDENCEREGCPDGCGGFSPKEWVDFKRYDLTSGLEGVDRRKLSQTEGEGTNYVQRHPDYVRVGLGNDFAIICLEQPVDGITPVKLNSDRNIPVDGKKLEVFGWGNTNPDSDADPIYPDLPQTVTVDYITNEACMEPAPFEYKAGRITENMMCAAAPGKDSCQGDSGMCDV